MTTEVIPTIVVHEVASGSTMDGTAPDGTDSEETVSRGRVRRFAAGTHGGLFVAPPVIGMSVFNVSWNLPAAAPPTVVVSLVDMDNVEYVIQSFTATTSGTVSFSSKGILVPPDWKIKVATTSACNAAGRVTLCMGRGWGQPTMGWDTTFGKSARP